MKASKAMRLHMADLPKVVPQDTDTARKDMRAIRPPDILKRETTHHILPSTREKQHHTMVAKYHRRDMRQPTLGLRVQKVKRV